MDLTEKTLESREVYRGRILRVREDRGHSVRLWSTPAVSGFWRSTRTAAR